MMTVRLPLLTMTNPNQMREVLLFVFSVLTSLGEERANRSAFHTLFDLGLFGFVGFLFLLGSGKGCCL